MDNKGMIVRSNKRENPYALIDKCGLEDERLSWKAKGLLAYLLSKPDDWAIYVTELVNHAKDKKDSLRAGMNELVEFGYISMMRVRDSNNRFKGVQYTVYERPIETPEKTPSKKIKSSDPQPDFPNMEKPNAEKPDMEKPNAENPPLLINDLTKNDLTKIDRLIEPAAAGTLSTESDLIDPIFKELQIAGMDAAVGCVAGIRGVYQLSAHEHDLEKVYSALKKQFPNQLDKDVIRIACRLFMENAEISQRKNPNFTISNPVGWFLFNYKEAIVQYKAEQSKRKLNAEYGRR